jgi:hypothetical protein
MAVWLRRGNSFSWPMSKRWSNPAAEDLQARQ